jgi:glycosyltransferase 2 family protein
MFIVGLGLMWILSRGIQWEVFIITIRSVSIPWLLVYFLCLFLSCLARVWRWSLIVRAVRSEVTFRSLFSATQIGFLSNFILPGRIGELIRAIVLSRLTNISVSQCLALVAVDRVTDLFGLIGVLLVALTTFQPVKDISIPAEMLGLGSNTVVFRADLLRTGALAMTGALVCLVMILALLYSRQKFVLSCSDAVLGKVWPWLGMKVHSLLFGFAQGLHVFRFPKEMAFATGISLITWGLFTAAMAAVCQAFHLNWPWYTPFLLQAAIALSISIPGAPGFIGQYHVPIIAVLMMIIPSITLDASYAIAWVVYLMNLFLVVMLGLYSLRIEGFRIMELRCIADNR